MVRPERRRDVLTGGSPVRVSAGAPGSRLPSEGEIRLYEAECQKPLKEREANQRAATISERHSLVKLSAERRLGGPSRSYHGEGNRQQSARPDGMLYLSGVSVGGTLGKNSAEQERPYLAVGSDEDRGYKAGRLKAHGAGRESEGCVVPMKACSKTRWREGTLLWSRRRRGKREGMPVMANNPFDKARQLDSPAMGVSQVSSKRAGIGEGGDNRHDNPVKGRGAYRVGHHARHIEKTIGKPCAGKPHARFERGSLETGRRKLVPR
jgi:hypothetical protein